MKKIILLLLLLGPAAACFCLTEYAFDSNKDGRADKWYVYEDGYVNLEKTDLNFDGVADCVVTFDKKGKKTREEIDNNFDGTFDTFYSYEKGKLTLEEIDSNYDGMIDLRIYIDGIHVLRYEQDTDFDGIFDKSRMFGAD